VCFEDVSTIYFYTLFDPTSGKPRCAGIRIGDKITVYDLFRPGAGKKIRTINETIAKIREFLITSNDRGHTIIASNFKKLLHTYGLPLDSRQYNVYDVHIDNPANPIRPTNSQSKDNLLLRKILERMASGHHYEYQKLISNAAVVYQDLENRGLFINDELFRPEWSMITFSGRSKTTGFNIQGFHEDHYVRTVDASMNSVLLHFDWISADIRAASLLSGDPLLTKSFESSDPYTEMVGFFQKHRAGEIDREECKKYLLRSINSMDIESDAFVIYQQLGEWILKCYNITRKSDGFLETLLHRRFKVSRAKNALAVLNGAMQGSVAHAMHAAIRRIWERLGSYILVEIHDSIIMSVPNDSAVIRATIDTVAPIMMHPFSGLLADDPLFPVRVSIGKRWKKWQLLETHRASGIERVQKTRQATPTTAIEGQETGKPAEA